MIQIIYHLIVKGSKYDVVHTHYVFPSGLLGLLFKKIFGTKLILTAHGRDINRMARKNSFIFNLTKIIMEQADQIVAVGEKLKEDIAKDFSIPEEKVSIINMGVNRVVFTPMAKTEAKGKLKLSEGSFHLLFIGNKIKTKGLLELVKAYQLLKPKYSGLELHIVGADKEPIFLGEVKQEIAINRVKNVYFYPPLNQKEVALWMSAADAFI